jgi:hypothetical protein
MISATGLIWIQEFGVRDSIDFLQPGGRFFCWQQGSITAQSNYDLKFTPLPSQSIRGWIPDDDEGETPATDTLQLWDQSADQGTDQAWQAPEIELGDGGTLVLESA